MAKKQQKINFGVLPRDGFVYSLYRGHIIRLGLVTAAMIAVLCWAWSGSWVTVRSYLAPAGSADLAAISDTSLPPPAEKPDGAIFDDERIENRGAWVQNHCYRLKVTFDNVEKLDLTLDNVQLYLVTADEFSFLAAGFADVALPATETVYQAVFTPVSEDLSYYLQQLEQHAQLPGYLIDLRALPVGYENADTAQMLIFTPVVLILLVFWLLLIQNPSRHPIYRQLSRYGMSVAAIVAAIDQEVAGGGVISDTGKLIVTASWRIQRSAFTSTIYKNTSPADIAAGREGNDI